MDEAIKILFREASAVVVLAFNFVAFMKEWIVVGSTHTRIVEAKDKEIVYWRDMALKNFGLAERSTSLTEAVVKGGQQ